MVDFGWLGFEKYNSPSWNLRQWPNFYDIGADVWMPACQEMKSSVKFRMVVAQVGDLGGVVTVVVGVRELCVFMNLVLPWTRKVRNNRRAPVFLEDAVGLKGRDWRGMIEESVSVGQATPLAE